MMTMEKEVKELKINLPLLKRFMKWSKKWQVKKEPFVIIITIILTKTNKIKGPRKMRKVMKTVRLESNDKKSIIK